MTDSDDESAFESADEGEEVQQQTIVLQPSLKADNQGASNFQAENKDVHNDTLRSSSNSENILRRSGDVVISEHQAEGYALETEAIASEKICALPQSGGSALDIQEDDEGLGDWGAAWEVEEDVLATNSPITSADKIVVEEKCDDQKEVSCGNKGLKVGSSRDGKGNHKQQMQEDINELGKSANKEWVLDKLNAASEQQKLQTSSWGWGNWGTSILSTASSSMSSFTSQVGHGLNSVLESVEATLGAPTPEELAAQHSTSKESESEVPGPHMDEASTCEQNVESQFFLGTPIAVSVGSISSKVIAGSLDTLELIGRKTMDLLQEGDPGFKKKRSLLRTEKPVLSEVLREAKERESDTSLTEGNGGELKINFGTVFDDYQGLVHLEALEMLSKQSEQRVQVCLISLKDDELTDMQRLLENIKETYESQTDIDSEGHLEQEFEKLIKLHLESINLPVNLEKLFKTQYDSQSWLHQCITDQDKGEKKDAKEIHVKAIHFMAEFTALAIEVVHKMSELALVLDDVDVSHGLQSFASFANVLCLEVAIQSSKYSSCLSTAADDCEDPDSVNPLITSVFLEASNSNTYIQDACHLLVPVFQLKLIMVTSNKDA